MSNGSARIASALLLGAVVGVAAIALPQRAASAAENCLSEPNKDETPQGRHWYYRIERGTGHHCWYLRGQDDRAAQADAPKSSEKAEPRRADPAKSDQAKTDQAKTDQTMSRSVSNAHAELTPKTRVADDSNAAAAVPSVWPNPAASTDAANNAPANTAGDNTKASTLSSRWPQTSGVTSSSSPPDATLMVADAQPEATATADSSPEPAPPPAMTAPPDRNIGSIQKLFIVAIGALALAGLTGSAVYRLGRRRKRNDWLRERSNWQSEENPHTPPWIEPRAAQPNPALADLDESVVPRSDFALAMAETESGDRVEKIEEFLARLTKQLQAELETPRAN
jgi:hypothetical protein